jgi:uracil-DNA glycosylase family 4
MQSNLLSKLLLRDIGDGHAHSLSGELATSRRDGHIYRALRKSECSLTNLDENEKLTLTESGDSIEKVSSEVLVCTKCRLCETRKHAVPGEGFRSAKVLFVGEAPGEQEDLQGRPFVGAAGKLLTELLQSVNIRREDVYITNTVKCRPPNNRPPRKDESPACRPYLDRQIALIRPTVICPMGNSAIQAFLDSNESITALHGIPFEIKSVTYFPMYHPAAALYTFSLRKVMEEDFRKLRALLDSMAD